MDSLKDDLTEVFADVFDLDDIVLTPEMTASDVDGWDSLAQIRLVVAAEQRFNVQFTADEISNLANVGDFMRLIAEKVQS
jgi:acyl carrier protein